MKIRPPHSPENARWLALLIVFIGSFISHMSFGIVEQQYMSTPLYLTLWRIAPLIAAAGYFLFTDTEKKFFQYFLFVFIANASLMFFHVQYNPLNVYYAAFVLIAATVFPFRLKQHNIILIFTLVFCLISGWIGFYFHGNDSLKTVFSCVCMIPFLTLSIYLMAYYRAVNYSQKIEIETLNKSMKYGIEHLVHDIKSPLLALRLINENNDTNKIQS